MRRVNVPPAADALRDPTIATARPGQQRGAAADRDQRRGGVDREQRARVFGFALRHEAPAEPRGRHELALGLGAARDLEAGTTRPAADLRQGVERRAGAAILVDEPAKGARPDAFAADEAQPVESLLVAERDPAHPFCPIRPSVPARRRAMLAWCFANRITTMHAITTAGSRSPNA